MKELSIVMLAAVLAMGTLQAEEPANIPSFKKNFHLFLLMGQSNMSGGVGLAAGDTQPVPQVLKMRYAKEGDEPKWAPGAHPRLQRRQKMEAREKSSAAQRDWQSQGRPFPHSQKSCRGTGRQRLHPHLRRQESR